jgi:hypothetical protein
MTALAKADPALLTSKEHRLIDLLSQKLKGSKKKAITVTTDEVCDLYYKDLKPNQKPANYRSSMLATLRALCFKCQLFKGKATLKKVSGLGRGNVGQYTYAED